MKKLWKRIQRHLKKISVVDKFLIFLMIILLSQSAYSLFVGTAVNTDTVDVIVRTSAAAIFGYFLSGNFIKSCSKDTSVNKSTPSAWCGEVQIVVVSVIGTVSLIILLIILLLFRNYSAPTPQTAATVSQLRDFVSACVGFLVSSDKER